MVPLRARRYNALALWGEMLTLKSRCQCDGGRPRNTYNGNSVLSDAARIWPPFAVCFAGLFNDLVGVTVLPKCAHIAGLAHPVVDASIRECLTSINYSPSGGRAVETVSNRIAACIQPTKRLAPTLLPEGLGPEAHLKVALEMQHPFARPPELDVHIEDAINAQPSDPGILIARRSEECKVLGLLRDALVQEWEGWLPQINIKIRPIVGRRMVPFCREVSYCIAWMDLGLWPDYVMGLPMTGWACHSLAFPGKLTLPSTELAEITKVDTIHNAKVLSSVSSTGDTKLDMASWNKSLKEFECQTLIGPLDPGELPAGTRLLPRRPIWECHGGKLEASCRNIDDCLAGGQNGPVGLTAVHRPCTVDTLVAGGRRIAEKFPKDLLEGFSSDFGGAYRQVPGHPGQSNLFGVTMWDAYALRVVIGMAVAQLFGSRSAPLNFSRYADWCSKCGDPIPVGVLAMH